MYVLGELVELWSKESQKITPMPLPLPWYQRAPLGFLSDTNVFVSILKDSSNKKDGSGKYFLGDLVVSVIDPTRHLLKVRARRQERPGVLAEVFSGIHTLFKEYNINIALAEAVTTECRQFHDVTLVTELLLDQDKKTIKNISKLVKDKLGTGTQDFPEPIIEVEEQAPVQNVGWLGKGIVKHGWVYGCHWREALDDFARHKGVVIDRAVVYSDQDSRVARFVFPRNLAMTVVIEHADIPGALEELTKALRQAGFNLLSALLRRGGAMAGNATLIAVCEPTAKESKDELTRSIKQAVRAISPRYRASPPIIRLGRRPESTLNPRHPEDRVIQVPTRLRQSVNELRKGITKGAIPVFLSRRFAGDTYRSKEIAKIVEKVLRERGFVSIEARPDPLDVNPTTIEQVESRLWASDLGIVLVMNIGQPEPFSPNLAHEYGFLHGQDKPVVFLVERSLVAGLSGALSNIQGLVILDFADGDEAYDASHPQSVTARLGGWLDRVGPRLRHHQPATD